MQLVTVLIVTLLYNSTFNNKCGLNIQPECMIIVLFIAEPPLEAKINHFDLILAELKRFFF